MNTPEIKVLSNLKNVALEAAGRIIIAATEAIALQDRFSIALAGGLTPKVLYEMLATDEFRGQIDWTKVHIFFGDERCVPPDHPDSNYRMAHATLLGKVLCPGDNIHRIRGEIDPDLAAIEYGKLLKEHFGDGGLDLVLLGMGADGHTASLFPYTDVLKETKHRCVSNYVEKTKSWRVTMTAPFINRAQVVLVLAAGVEKAARLQEVLEGPKNPERLPIQLIAPITGKMAWLLDTGAAGMKE